MSDEFRSFENIYQTIYENPQYIKETFATEMKSINKSFTDGIGHPNLQNLQYGEVRQGSIIVFFMDIRGFTKISIALKNEELIRVLQATTIASVISVKQYGGYVIDFTGDGIMAYFGNGINTTEKDGLNSLMAATDLMKGIKETVNARLSQSGDETIKVGIGLEYGNALWTKIGVPNECQVKPVSEVTYIAGKSSSNAHAWEAVMGKNIAEWVPEQFKEVFEPYEFQFNKEKYSYKRWLFKWDKFYEQFHSNNEQTKRMLYEKRLPALNTIVFSSNGPMKNITNTSSNGPRPLKDQPFFIGKIIE
jgi:adenylate cyclase